MNTTIFVGLDVHKTTVVVAVAEGLRGGEVRQLGTFPNRAEQIAKLAERLAKGGRRLSFSTRRDLAATVFTGNLRVWGITASWWSLH